MSLRAGLCDNGFVVAGVQFDQHQCNQWVSMFEATVPSMAVDVDCTVKEYLKSVSTWNMHHPSVNAIVAHLAPQVSAFLETMMGYNAELIDGKLLMKGEHSPQATHAHQDLAYRWKENDVQYHYSTWIPLTEVGIGQSPLELLPGSHNDEVGAPQDYLKKGFVDRRLSKQWQDRREVVLVKPGEMIVFDSKIWHASSRWIRQPTRYAVILRWRIPGKPDMSLIKPAIEPRSIYNLSDWVEEHLRKMIDSESKGNELLVECINNEKIPKLMTVLVKRYLVSRLAHEMHGGGSQSGGIYDSLARCIDGYFENQHVN